MRRVVTFVLALLAAAVPALAGPAPQVQETSGSVLGVTVPLELREQFLGTSAGKTVVRFTLSFSRSDLRERAKLAPRVHAFFVAGQPLTASFFRALPPGEVTLRLGLEAATGKAMALRAVTLSVPRMTSEFRAEDGGPLSASTILLEEANREEASAATELLRFLPPQREVPVGLLRIDCEAKPPITRVEFHLGDKLLVAKNRPPFTVEIDLGAVPRKQTCLLYTSRCV